MADLWNLFEYHQNRDESFKLVRKKTIYTSSLRGKSWDAGEKFESQSLGRFAGEGRVKKHPLWGRWSSLLKILLLPIAIVYNHFVLKTAIEPYQHSIQVSCFVYNTYEIVKLYENFNSSCLPTWSEYFRTQFFPAVREVGWPWKGAGKGVVLYKKGVVCTVQLYKRIM